MNKRLLLIGGNFSPELTGIGKYNGEMIDMLASQGYQCSVITTFPYYPHWNVQEPYTKSSRWFRKELKIPVGGESSPIEIFRCPHYIPKKPTSIRRVISDFSFCISAFFKLIQLLFTKKFDFVLVVAPPFHLGLLGILYKKIRGARFLYHIQDLQIDAARDLKMIRSKFVIDMLFKIEKFILKQADVVSSISEGMIKKIEDKYPREVVLFPNWVDTGKIFPLPEKEKLKREFDFDATSKIILYSGATGVKQGLESILESAKALEHHPNVKFVICGSGPYLEQLKARKEKLKLNNVIFLPLQPFEKLNWLLNMADIHLVLQKGDAADLVMPSKLTAILSVGGVAIVTACKGSSLYDMVSSHGMGILIEPENPTTLTAAINKTLKNTDNTIHQNARWYAERYLSKDIIFQQYSLHMQ